MKSKKLIFIFMIMLVMSGIVSKKAEAAVNVTAENGVTYSMDYYEKTAVVTGYNSLEECIIIPEEYDGCKVIRIEDKAFKDSNLVSIIIPNTVNEIGAFAFFDCGNLTNLSLPAGLEELGEHAFWECENLSFVTFLGNPELGDAVFEDCSNLESIVVLENLTQIPANTFSNCKNLRNFTIPETVTYIGNYAFSNTGLSGDFTIPASVKSIGADIIKGTAIVVIGIIGKGDYTKG